MTIRDTSTTAARIAATVDLDRVLALARSASPLPSVTGPPGLTLAALGSSPVIAVAADEAFSFRYEENLDLLRAAGATIARFSPLCDAALPQGTQAVYLCGGFPELYAERLSANQSMLAAMRAATTAGLPIYAECGGLMYLTEAVMDAAGNAFPMVGALPGRSVMTPRLTLGYRTVQALDESWLWHAGEMVRGHEFHYSTCEGIPETLLRLYAVQSDALCSEPRIEEAHAGNVLASYIHLHFLARPELATRFVAAARAVKEPS